MGLRLRARVELRYYCLTCSYCRVWLRPINVTNEITACFFFASNNWKTERQRKQDLITVKRTQTFNAFSELTMEFKSQNKLLLLVWTREHECLIVLETHENYSSAIFKPCYRKQPLKSRFLCKNPAFYNYEVAKKPCFLQKYIYFCKNSAFLCKKAVFLCWFIFKVYLKFRKFEPRYSYKIYFYRKNKCINYRISRRTGGYYLTTTKQTRFWLFLLQCFSIFGKILLLQ